MGSSIATSFGVRWIDGSKAEGEGTVSSPRRKNPKNAIVQAAQSMIVSGSSPRGDHRCLSLRRIVGVMGSRNCFPPSGNCARTLATPLDIILSLGMAD